VPVGIPRVEGRDNSDEIITRVECSNLEEPDFDKK
jgi:hypothetical protein